MHVKSTLYSLTVLLFKDRHYENQHNRRQQQCRYHQFSQCHFVHLNWHPLRSLCSMKCMSFPRPLPKKYSNRLPVSLYKKWKTKEHSRVKFSFRILIWSGKEHFSCGCYFLLFETVYACHEYQCLLMLATGAWRTLFNPPFEFQIRIYNL